MQRTRQAAVVINRVKNKNSKPVIIAPAMLAVAISITKSITAVSSVPSMPVKSSDIALHMHRSALAPDKTLSVRITPRPITATANNAQRKGVDTVNMPETVKNPAIIPITILARTAMPIQLGLQLQLFIKSPPIKAYAIGNKNVITHQNTKCRGLFCNYKHYLDKICKIK